MAEQIRKRVDSLGFWVVVAYFGLALVVVALFFINQKTSANIKRTAADEAAHSSEIIANARARYGDCVASIPELEKINRFVRGVQALHIAQELNSREALRATEPTDPLYPVRVASYRRFKEAADLVAGVRFSVPTRSTCAALRRRLLAQA